MCTTSLQTRPKQFTLIKFSLALNYSLEEAQKSLVDNLDITISQVVKKELRMFAKEGMLGNYYKLLCYEPQVIRI